MYKLEDLPIGTRLISQGDRSVTGVVTQHGPPNDRELVTIEWTNGNVTVWWAWGLSNPKVQD